MCNEANCEHKATALAPHFNENPDSPDYLKLEINIPFELEKHKQNLEALLKLDDIARSGGLSAKSNEFAASLVNNYVKYGNLSQKQWPWVHNLLGQVSDATSIPGSFDPILVMFRLAAATEKPSSIGRALKNPKVRLMTDGGRYVELRFFSDRTKTVDIYIDGWQGHGRRKFAGWIHKDKIVPYRKDRMNDDIIKVINDLSQDPMKTAKAMAAKLGVCMYCGKRLSDIISKLLGYGPICAKNYGLPGFPE